MSKIIPLFYQKCVSFKTFLISIYINYYLTLNLCWKILINISLFAISSYTFYHLGGVDFIIYNTKKVALFFNFIQEETPRVPYATEADWYFNNKIWEFKEILPERAPEMGLNLKSSYKSFALESQYAWYEQEAAHRQAIADAIAKEQFDKDFSSSLSKILFFTGVILVIIIKSYSNTP